MVSRDAPAERVAAEELSGEDVLPGLRCKVSDFFIVPTPPPAAS
jgi:hypothetical protein